MKLGVRPSTPGVTIVKVESRSLAELEEDLHRLIGGKQRQRRALIPGRDLVTVEHSGLADDARSVVV